MRRRLARGLVAVLLVLLLAGCGGWPDGKAPSYEGHGELWDAYVYETAGKSPTGDQIHHQLVLRYRGVDRDTQTPVQYVLVEKHRSSRGESALNLDGEIRGGGGGSGTPPPPGTTFTVQVVYKGRREEFTLKDRR